MFGAPGPLPETVSKSGASFLPIFHNDGIEMQGAAFRLLYGLGPPRDHEPCELQVRWAAARRKHSKAQPDSDLPYADRHLPLYVV